jgi:tryptophan halogenase
MSAAALMNLIQALAAPYGLERSCKAVPGALEEDRFLVSLHRTAFGGDVAGSLIGMGRKLGAPDAVLEAIGRAEANADIVHLGYEGGARATYKIYLEYAGEVRRAQERKADEPVLVHLAFKWMPAAGSGETTRYTWLPARTHAEIGERVRGLTPDAPRALACVLEVLARACARVEAEKLFLMQVEEPDNVRCSCDLNLYQADFHLRDIADVLSTLGGELAVPRDRMAALIARCGSLALGHIAGGRGRDATEFVTVYYGVEAHG